MTVPCPRILIAGTNSGVGKTSVALALVSALRKRGLRVQPFKVGPDYLDPTYLSAAAERPCYNLDGWMTGRDYVEELFATRAANADISVIEGVMGLFDGSDPVHAEGSTAEIAVWLDCPVLLVVNAHGLSRSVAALVKGYSTFDPQVRMAGVIANQCGSERHADWLGESLAAFGMPRLAAAVPRGAFPELPRRHLGLVTADSFTLSRQVLDELAVALENQCSVDEILAIASTAPHISEPGPQRGLIESGKPIRLGIARDAAFHFYYPDNLEALSAAGCELAEFSPITDAAVPEDVEALYIGGGYPEEHAAALSENKPMLESVRRFANNGRPVYAECGGLMYLSKGIESRKGERFAMAGLLPSWTRMLERLKSLGYVEITLAEDSLLGRAGWTLRGHEFHYSDLTGDPTENGEWTLAYSMKRRRTEEAVLEGFQRGRVLASYVHTHFASKQGSVEHFLSMYRKGTAEQEPMP